MLIHRSFILYAYCHNFTWSIFLQIYTSKPESLPSEWRCTAGLGVCAAYLCDKLVPLTCVQSAGWCSRCEALLYCSRSCQVKHWKAGHNRCCETCSHNSLQEKKVLNRQIREMIRVAKSDRYALAAFGDYQNLALTYYRLQVLDEASLTIQIQRNREVDQGGCEEVEQSSGQVTHRART